MVSTHLRSTALARLRATNCSLTRVITRPQFQHHVTQSCRQFLAAFASSTKVSICDDQVQTVYTTGSRDLRMDCLRLIRTGTFLTGLITGIPITALTVFSRTAVQVILHLFRRCSGVGGRVRIHVASFPALSGVQSLHCGRLNALVGISKIIAHHDKIFPRLGLMGCSYNGYDTILKPCIRSLGRRVHVDDYPRYTTGKPFAIGGTRAICQGCRGLALRRDPKSIPTKHLPHRGRIVLL